MNLIQAIKLVRQGQSLLSHQEDELKQHLDRMKYLITAKSKL